MRTEPARVILVDDHPLVRDGLHARLEAMAHLRVIGEAGNADEALALAADEANPRDLALMDVGMAGMNGIQPAALFHERHPGGRVLMLSMHDNVEYVTQAVRAGASGYVLKDSPATEIILAIDAVLAGKTFFSAGLAARMIQAQSMRTPIERLTPARTRDSRCPGARFIEQADCAAARLIRADGGNAPAQSEAQTRYQRSGRVD